LVILILSQRWLLVHRAHFHDGLKAAAQAAGKGEPACLHTSSKVVDVDPQAATVTLETGDIFKGDVVIGADGVHSFTRTKISKDKKPFSSGRNAFRFLISRQQALDDPETASIAQDFGAVDLWDSEERRVVIYPCDNNKLLNFVCIHPETDTPTGISPTGDSYNQQVGKEALLEVYKHFNSQVKKLLEKADPQTLKLWPLLDMDTLPTWVEDRLAILGDAAHPFLPYRASGGAMAIEDAVSLAVMLPGDIGRDEVPERLKVYEMARHERATTIQQMTRDSSKMLSPEKGMSCLFHPRLHHSSQNLILIKCQRGAWLPIFTAMMSSITLLKSSANTSGPKTHTCTGASLSSSDRCPALGRIGWAVTAP
jgi:2-polyprenyl-6-methoxyphenol hydroxylase-like FAD-dependent oxidoreductase